MPSLKRQPNRTRKPHQKGARMRAPMNTRPVEYSSVPFNAELGPTLYVPAPTATRPCPTAAAGAAASSCRRSRWGCGRTSATTARCDDSRAILRRAFDLGITHFDLANNYGPPYGSAEINFGRIFAEDFRALPRRAGHLDQGRLGHVARPLRRVGLAQVPARAASTRACSGWASTTSTSSTRTASTPRRRCEETMGALDTAVRAGQGALRRHLLLRPRADRARRRAILRELGHAAADPPAVLLDAQPLDRGRSCSTCSSARASARSSSRRSRRAC